MKVLSYDAESWHDLEYIYFLTGFPEIDVTMVGRRHFRLFYRVPCRYLDTVSGRFDCTLHGTPEKPLTCVEYDESDCFYRHAHLGPPLEPSRVIRLDRRRFLAVAPLMRIDRHGKIAGIPTLDELLAAIRRDAPDPAPAVRRLRVEGHLADEPLPDRAFDDRRSPCDACAALCCQALVFDKPTPRTVTNLEYMRYQLGFPGVEVAVTEKGWRLLVRATCVAFDADVRRCTIHGLPERPALCRFYNQFVCDYRRFFSAGPDDVLRLRLPDALKLLERLPTDGEGHLPHDLSVARLRRVLEEP